VSTLFLSEFSDLPITSNGVAQMPGAQFWLADQTIAIGGSSATSAAFNDETAFIVVVADAACSIAWTAEGAESVNPATTSNWLLPANTPCPFGVAGGMRISAIANS
jgi:hypothetical protein